MSSKKIESVQIQLDKLYPSPLNTYSTTDVEDLVESIRLNGLMQPLYVEGPHEDGCYEVLGGSRRLKAIQTINKDIEEDTQYTEVPCIVTPIVDDVSMKKIIIETLNLSAREMDTTERYRHYFLLVEAINSLNPTLRQSKRVDIFRKYVTKTDRFSSAFFHVAENSKIKELVTNADLKVGIIDASYAVGLPEEQQNEWIQRVSAKEKPSDVYDYITGRRLNMLTNPLLCEFVKNHVATIAEAECVATDLSPEMQQAWCEEIIAGANPVDEYKKLKEKQTQAMDVEKPIKTPENPIPTIDFSGSPSVDSSETTRKEERFIPLSEIEAARQKQYAPAQKTNEENKKISSNAFTFPTTFVAQADNIHSSSTPAAEEISRNAQVSSTESSAEREEFSPDQITEALAALSSDSNTEESSYSDVYFDVAGGNVFEEDSEFDGAGASFGTVDTTGRAASLFKPEKQNGKDDDDLTVEDVRRMLTSIRRMSNQLHDYFDDHADYEAANVFADLIEHISEIDI